MSNLLPFDEKKKIARARRARAVAVAALLLFYAGTIASVALFPSYLLLRVKENNVVSELADIRKEDFTKESESLAAVVRDINTKLHVFSHDDAVLPVQEFITPLLLEKHPGVAVTSFHMEHSDTGTVLSIEGEARARADLIAFVDTLKQDARFSGVNLPVSNLVRDKNIQFSLQFNSAEN